MMKNSSSWSDASALTDYAFCQGNQDGDYPFRHALILIESSWGWNVSLHPRASRIISGCLSLVYTCSFLLPTKPVATIIPV